jgi:hypothetical protein
MKNKNNENNKTAADLLNLIVEVRELHNGGYDQFAHSYATGTLISIIDSALNGYYDLQEGVNLSYNNHLIECNKIKSLKIAA